MLQEVCGCGDRSGWEAVQLALREVSKAVPGYATVTIMPTHCRVTVSDREEEEIVFLVATLSHCYAFLKGILVSLELAQGGQGAPRQQGEDKNA